MGLRARTSVNLQRINTPVLTECRWMFSSGRGWKGCSGDLVEFEG